MPDTQEIEALFWKALQSDMTMMLGLAGDGLGHTRPMTAQVEGDHGPIWFFTSTESELAGRVKTPQPAIATFTAKGHDLFACTHGSLTVEHDRTVLDRLWNRFVAAWYEGGKDDPKLVLLRLDPAEAEIWLNGSSLIAGLKMLFGADPQQDYKDNVARVALT